MIYEYIEDERTFLKIHFNPNEELVIVMGRGDGEESEQWIIMDEEMCDWLIKQITELKDGLKDDRIKV